MDHRNYSAGLGDRIFGRGPGRNQHRCNATFRERHALADRIRRDAQYRGGANSFRLSRISHSGQNSWPHGVGRPTECCLLYDGGCVVEMTLEEAEWIARNYLPDEPRPDE